ncbi:acetyl-CoA carboxylase biotin carboxylase subunit family protein [Streptomyces sp. NPDC056347]|uniref:ATP-grasp domain-containing protein n=1 Tax=Streptomyces sp. NPDC056347 TaxID=3345790 RepID=UPI0035DE0C04
MSEPPRIAVVYERGAVTPAEIAVGLADLGTVLFAVPQSGSPHLALVQPLLQQLGEVVELTGDLETDLGRLRAHRPAAILTFSESRLRTAARLAAGLRLSFHDIETVRLLTDKVQQRARLREAGLDRVRCRGLCSAEEWPTALAEIGLPAVVKPVQGEGSRNTLLVRSAEEAEQLLPLVFAGLDTTAWDEPVVVVEELLQGRPSGAFADYVSVESMCGPHGIAHFAVTGKFPLLPPFRETGIGFWPAAVGEGEQREILDLTTRALQALGVTLGLTHTEVKLTPDGPRIIEVNGRIGGQANLLYRHAHGVDLVRIAGLLALGESVAPPDLRSDGQVHFLCSVVGPTQPCTYVAVHGEAEVRALPGIAGYQLYTRPGERLAEGVMTRHLDAIWGRCADHEELTTLRRNALMALSHEFDFPFGRRRVPATELMH